MVIANSFKGAFIDHLVKSGIATTINNKSSAKIQEITTNNKEKSIIHFKYSTPKKQKNCLCWHFTFTKKELEEIKNHALSDEKKLYFALICKASQSGFTTKNQDKFEVALLEFKELMELIDINVSNSLIYVKAPYKKRWKKFRISSSNSYKNLHKEVKRNPAHKFKDSVTDSSKTDTKTKKNSSNLGKKAKKKVAGFYFEGKYHEINTWKELLLKLCEILYHQHKKDFEKVLEMKGSKKNYFSKKPKGMTSPKPVKGSGIYAETHHSADAISKICKDLILKFGYSIDALLIASPEESCQGKAWQRKEQPLGYAKGKTYISQCVNCIKMNHPSCPGATKLNSKQYCSFFVKKINRKDAI